MHGSLLKTELYKIEMNMLICFIYNKIKPVSVRKHSG